MIAATFFTQSFFSSASARAAAPDLIVTGLTLYPAQPAIGQVVMFTATIKNIGNQATPVGIPITVAFSVDTIKSAWSYNNGTSLAAGASVSLTANGGPVSASWTATAGNHVISALVDDQGKIPESNETNNSLNQNLNLGSDLVVTSLSLSPMNPTPGQSVSFTAVIKNNGAQATPVGVPVTVAFAVDNVKTSWSYNDGTPLASGASLTLTANGGPVSSFWGATSGNHVITATADDQNRIPEGIETNNVFNLNLTVAGGTYTTLTTSDASLTLGRASSVSYSPPASSSGVVLVPAAANASSLIWELNPDPWALSAGSGAMSMAYSGQGAITTAINLNGMNSAVTNAYPFILYGADVFGYRTNGQAPQFPSQLKSMASLMIDASYALSGTMYPKNVDVLFDEWLMPTANYSSGVAGAVEVEILPYFNFTGADYWGTFVRTFTVPVILNGVSTAMDFKEYASQIGKGAGTDVLFYPVSTGLISGEIQFDAILFFKEAAGTAAVTSDWWVAGVDLGTEFGGSSTANYQLKVNKLNISQTLFKP